jgi:predicted methyltransferase
MFKEILTPKITQEELELVQEISVLRPKSNRAIDQIYMKPICMLIQAKLIAPYLDNKDLIFMGDGDHQSVLCGIYSQPKSITVLDIDSKIVKNIPRVARKYNIEIDAYQYDVLKPLPVNFIRKFNFFYTNPPFGSKNAGQSGITFIGRCIEACKFPSEGCIVLPHDNERNWTREVMENAQKFLLDQGWIIIEKLVGLHIYYLDDATLASGTMIIEQIKEIKSPIEGKSIRLNLY